MRTTIGLCPGAASGRLAGGTAFAMLVVAVDLALVWWDRYPVSTEGRGVLALIALAANVWLFRGDGASLGLAWPVQGGWYWFRVTLVLGLAVGVCILVGLGAWVWSGHMLPVYTVQPREAAVRFLQMCLFAPVLEETIYRLVLCVPLTALAGPWTAVFVSGLVFGFLHVVYGNPSPENLVGGFFLAWAYLKSQSILVPVLMHSLGNGCALASQIAAWYWFPALA